MCLHCTCLVCLAGLCVYVCVCVCVCVGGGGGHDSVGCVYIVLAWSA